MKRGTLRPVRSVLCAALVALPAVASPTLARAENPWEELMGPEKPRPWNDPDGRFQIGVPIGWRAEQRKGAKNLTDLWKTHPDYGATAHVTVELRAIPPKVALAHLAVRTMEELKNSARSLQLIDEDTLTVSGTPARRRYFTYQERGHAELTNEVVQVLFIVGERAFIITLETAAGARQIFWEDFEKMIKSFTARGSGENGDDGDKLPGERRRVRAGEMVNPDAVKY